MDTYIGLLMKTGSWLELCFCGVILMLGYIFWDEFRPEVTSKIKGISSQILWDIFWIIMAANFILTSQALPIILCFVLIVVMMKRKRDHQIIEMRDVLTEQKYEQLKQLNQEAQIARHDWKNHLLAIHTMTKEKNYDELEKYLSQLTETVSTQQSIVVSGDSMIDAVLNQKTETAFGKNIRLNVNCDCMYGLKLAEKDIFIMLANLLDNAIEGAEKVDEDPWISINVVRNKNMLLIKISNSINKKPWKILNRFMTDKKDKKQHGFGMLSVERIIKRYEGQMDTSFDEKRFDVDVMIYDAFE